MSMHELEATIKQIAMPGKGILAADESTATITKRFAAISVESTFETRRTYRELLFTTPGIEQFINGVILYEETLGQRASNGKLFAELLAEKGIVPGIKVDKGLTHLPNTQNESITQGLDNLAERLATFKEMGARFAKWRAVLNISETTPSSISVCANAHTLARYAAICQDQGIVPIVEPELLMDGAHSLERSAQATENVLQKVFHALNKYGVLLEGMILKPSMVITGVDHAAPASIEAVAQATLKVLRRTVPAAVPTINFLSGGQKSELATAHLNAMNKTKNLPWCLSYSYGRALQDTCLKTWGGKAEHVQAAQAAFYKRAQLNSAACAGNYTTAMEA